jgi:hypothetical protein
VHAREGESRAPSSTLGKNVHGLLKLDVETGGTLPGAVPTCARFIIFIADITMRSATNSTLSPPQTGSDDS